jgi:hypothetical protein
MKSAFSSPGTPNTYSIPSFSRHSTRRSEAFMMGTPSGETSREKCGFVAGGKQGDPAACGKPQKPYSPVNVVGEVEGDASVLSAVGDGDPVRVEGA